MPITIGNDSDKGSYNPPRFCNCKRSNCLKLYCECFGYGVLCQPGSCNCYSCQNNADNEQLRNSTMEAILERNPNAFRPKADVLKRADSVQVVHKGCFCKKSNCLKKYCECFQAEIVCCELCRCAECKNFEGSAALKKLVGEAAAIAGGAVLASTSWSSAMLTKYGAVTAAAWQSVAAPSSSSAPVRVGLGPLAGAAAAAGGVGIDSLKRALSESESIDTATIGDDDAGATKKRRVILATAEQGAADSFAQYVESVAGSVGVKPDDGSGYDGDTLPTASDNA